MLNFIKSPKVPQRTFLQTCTAKKTVMSEKATKRKNTMKILMMFSIDLSIILFI